MRTQKVIRELTFRYRYTKLINSNQKTLEAYNKNAQKYIKSTFQDVAMYKPEMREWIDAALQSIEKNGRIFEIGSAAQRDAEYMRQQGYGVTCSDAVMSFVNILNEKNEDAVYFNVLKDTPPDGYSMFFANGVFPHFTPDELRYALCSLHAHLPPEGVLAFSIKYGLGEEWIKEKFEDLRFTHYWKLEHIFDLLYECGYTVVFENSNTGSYPSHRWLNIVCQKDV